MDINNRPLFCLLIKNTWQKLSRYYNQQFSSYGLSVPKALLLLELTPDRQENPRFLAAKLDLENSSMSGLLDRLEKMNLIERLPDPHDRRGILIQLTPEGKLARQKITSLVSTLDQELQEILSPNEIKNFRRITATINKHINEQSR